MVDKSNKIKTEELQKDINAEENASSRDAPTVLKVSKEEAEQIKAELEGAGAEVEVK